MSCSLFQTRPGFKGLFAQFSPAGASPKFGATYRWPFYLCALKDAEARPLLSQLPPKMVYNFIPAFYSNRFVL